MSLGVAARTEVAPRPGLEALALRPALTFARASGWYFAGGADVALAGRDRTDVIAALFVGRVYGQGAPPD
jgi:hypothetical protein